MVTYNFLSIFFLFQVSDILIHPHFFSSPNSSVAVLQLKDKAKISEHVLPVCLPKLQGGEVMVQEAYASRWILTNNHRNLSHYAPLSQTKLVELCDVAQCKREFAQGGGNTTMTSDNTLCVIRKPFSPQSSCPRIIPGFMVVPAVFPSNTDVMSGHKETQGASNIDWQLLGLESFSYEENSHQQSYIVHTRVANFRDWIEKNMK